VLACPRCGGRLRLIAPISDPLVAERLVAHLARTLGSPATPASRAWVPAPDGAELSIRLRRPRTSRWPHGWPTIPVPMR